MRRTVERFGQLLQLGGDSGDDDVGEAAAGLLCSGSGSRFSGEGVFIQPFDNGAEQRFLGLEVMVERLPRQACGFGCLLDRRTAETLAAEHRHRGVEDTGAGAHLTIFTKPNEMSNDGLVTRLPRSAVSAPVPPVSK